MQELPRLGWVLPPGRRACIPSFVVELEAWGVWGGP